MKTNKNSKLKGSVLFTVVSVMSLLIIFLTGTLVLAASANKRAHRTYCTSQAEYTARAAIESFTEAMSHNPDVAGAIVNLTGTIYPYVEMDSSGMGKLVCDVKQADGSIASEDNRIKVEKLGDTNYYYTSSGWENLQTVKVTATAKVGKEEKTVSLYIRKKGPNEIKPSPLKGLQTAGGNNAGLTEGTYTGALVVGALQAADTYSLNNGTVTNSDLNFINGNLVVSGDGLIVNVKHAMDGENENPAGTVIMGDLTMQNSKLINVDYVPAADFDHNNIPYLFVEGEIKGGGSAAGMELVNGNGAPFNIYAGSIDFSDAAMKWKSADLYLFKNDVVNKINGTKDQELYGWTYSVVNKTNNPQTEGGNVYTRGSLELYQVQLHGNVRVEKDLIIDASGVDSVRVDGDIVVGGGIYFGKIDPNTGLPPANQLKEVGGTIYCDHFYAGNAIKDGYTVEQQPVPLTPQAEVIKRCTKEAWDEAGGQDGMPGAFLSSDNKILKLASYDAETYEQTVYKDATGTIVPEDVAVDKIEITDTVFGSGTLNGIPVRHLSARPSEYTQIYPVSKTKEALLGEPGYEQYKIVKTLQEIRESLNIELDELTGKPKGFDTTIYPKNQNQMETKIGKTFEELRGLGYTGGTVTSTTYFTGDYSQKVIQVEPASDDVWLVFEDATLDAGTVIAINDQDHPVKIALIGDLNLNQSTIVTKFVYDQVKGDDGKIDQNKVAVINDTDKINVVWYGVDATTIKCSNDCTLSGTAKLPFTFLDMAVQGKVKAKYLGTYATTTDAQVYAWIGGALLQEAKTCNNFRMAYCEEGSGSSSSSDIKTAAGTYIISHYDQY